LHTLHQFEVLGPSENPSAIDGSVLIDSDLDMSKDFRRVLDFVNITENPRFSSVFESPADWRAGLSPSECTLIETVFGAQVSAPAP